MHPVHAVAANAASTTLLSTSDKTLVCTDLVTAQVKQKWWGHVARIEYVACLGGGSDTTSGGSTVVGEDVYASASYDATVRLWDSRSRSKEPLMVLEDAKDAVTCVASVAGEACIVTSSVDGKVRPEFVNDSVLFVSVLWTLHSSSSHNQIRIYDLRKAQLMTQEVRHPITSVSFGFDGTTYAASCLDGNIRLWDVQTSRTDPRKIWQTMHSLHDSGNYKLECAFTSNDRCVVSGSECGAVVVYPVQDPSASWSREQRRPAMHAKGLKLQRHTGPTCSVAACPQSSRSWLVLSASYDGSALVWASQEEAEHCLEK